MPQAIPKTHRGGMPVTFLDLDTYIGWFQDQLGFCTLTIGSNTYQQPVAMLEVGTPAEVTLADASHDDMTLGTTIVVTGNTVEGIMPDIQSASVGRRSCVMNESGGNAYVTVTDETNTKINGQGKRLLIGNGGWVILEESANDQFIIIGGAKVSLAAFA
jgi:hypothetical protein